jgi:hypothetical protein
MPGAWPLERRPLRLILCLDMNRVNLAAVLKYDGSKTMAAVSMNASIAAAGAALRRKRERQLVLLVTILPDDDMAELLTYQAQRINQAHAVLSGIERATDRRDRESTAEPSAHGGASQRRERRPAREHRSCARSDRGPRIAALQRSVGNGIGHGSGFANSH